MSLKFWGCWMLRRVFLLAVLCSACASAPVQAQATVTLAWDQAGPDLASVQAYIYRLYIGTSTAHTVLSVTCVAGGTVDATVPFSCTAAPVSEPPGAYTIEVTAGNTVGESIQSTPFSFTLIGLPAAPTNVRKK